jgi:hypothetical protein
MRVSAGRRAHSPESGPGFRVPRLRIRCRTLAIRLPASDNARIMSTAAAACAFRVTEPSPPQATDAPFATELCAGRPWRRRWQTVLWRRCPYSDSGAEIAFYVVLRETSPRSWRNCCPRARRRPASSSRHDDRRCGHGDRAADRHVARRGGSLAPGSTSPTDRRSLTEFVPNLSHRA